MIYDWQIQDFVDCDGAFLLRPGGYFETFKIESGHLKNKTAHMDRMARSIYQQSGLLIDFNETLAAFEAHVLSQPEVCAYDVVKCVYFPGEGTLYFQFRHSLTKPSYYQKGVELLVSDQVRTEVEKYHHKTTDRQPMIEMRQKAMEDGYFEVLFQTADGYLCEGTVSNIFFVTEAGTLVTPPLSQGILPGTVRQKICDVFLTDCQERAIQFSEMTRFPGCFITNALIGVMPVSAIVHNGVRVSFSPEHVQRITSILTKVGLE